MTQRLLASLAVTAVAFVLTARADDTQFPTKVPDLKGKAPAGRDAARPGADPKVQIEEAANQEERLRRQFVEFKESLLRLKQRYEKSSKQEERDKAKVLDEALARLGRLNTDTKFSDLVASLRTPEAYKDLDRLSSMLEKNQDIQKDLQVLLDLLLKDDRDSQLKKEIAEANRILTQVKEAIRRQEQMRTRTEMARGTPAELEKGQKQVTDKTREIIDPKASRGGEAKKADAKSSGKEGKEGRGEAKNDAKDPKGDARAKEGKEGAGKEGKPGEGKEGKEGKAGAGKEGKEGKAGAGKEGKEGKPGAGKEGKEGKPGAGKEGKPGEGKPSEGKPGAGKEGKPGDSKGGSESKGKGDGKGDAKGGESKSGEGKPGEGKPGKSQGGQPGQSGQPGESKDDGGQKQRQQPPQQPQDNTTPARKKIADAVENQKKAEDNLKKDKKPDAVEDEDKAVADLKAAQKKLEELLRQLREEEIERILAQLQARCEKMLAMQKAVRDGTVLLDKTIEDKQNPSREQQQNSNVLSDKEEEIIREANKAIGIVQAEGTAVAFAEVFQQVRGDMITVAGRLRRTDAGVVTVQIENDIIATLGEMVEALKKARADNKAGKTPPPGQGGPPPDPKLIDMLAELRMIRSMQVRVNQRTAMYHREYLDKEQVPAVESIADPKMREKFEAVQREVLELGNREKKIFKVTDDIAKGKNKAN